MKKDSRYVWYAIDIILFLAINLFLVMTNPGLVTEAIFTLSWPVIILFTLGIWRLTDTITHESVTEVFRAPFVGKEGFQGFMGTLLTCNACMGVWVSAIVFYLYVFFPTLTFALMIIMTFTCLERFLSKIYNFLEKRG